MLRRLEVRDIVLIEALELEFRAGLNVLTGETGAGKSILLDALGFALGRKTRRDLVRAGAGQGSVAAEFEVAADHPVFADLRELGLEGEAGELVLRRVASADGPSRAFVNDRRTSAEALARIGAMLVEVHGQHDDRGLLDPRAHGPLLDAFAGHRGLLDEVQALFAAREKAARDLTAARERLEQAAADAGYLRHAVDELDRLLPEPGEDERLDTERRLIQAAAKIGGEIAKAAEELSPNAEAALGSALRRLTQVADRAEGRLDPAIEALDRALSELDEASRAVGDAMEALSFDPGRLEAVEERLFAIRGLARKHNVQPDALPALAEDLRARLEEIDGGADRIAGLEQAAAVAEKAYDDAAAALTASRAAAAKRLDKAVSAELAPLKMENAAFITAIEPARPGQDGADDVAFTARINPGSPAGPIDRIASGGELSRFLLAIKVCLAGRAPGLSLIFDEIDRGVGGATAAAVGRRLGRLAETAQVLVVTHSPQVAAEGSHHFRIAKTSDGTVTRTDVAPVEDAMRLDEIARMLAGDTVTEEARQAARALIGRAGE